MDVLSRLSAGMVRDDGDGRRVFQHGLWPAKRRSVFVTDSEERRLRRVFDWGVVATLLAAILAGPFTPLWFRLFVMLPAAMIALELVLRQLTAHLPKENGRR
jgi:hypothetical protein